MAHSTARPASSSEPQSKNGDGAERPIGIGAIGAGGFGLYAMQHFTQLPEVKLVGMAGTHRPAAAAMAARFGIPDIEDVDEMLKREDIDMVYLSTPPFLHYSQGMAALAAGKHVFCEKPLALTVAQADEMIALAKSRGLLVVANLMQRYNPLYDKVKALIQSKALGAVLHGYFENYASDENLGPGHWFWNRELSGGIFIEHGVHFFDMTEGWFGPGKVVNAARGIRPGTNLEEQVTCTARFGDVLFNFYHGFHQPGRLDRQELRILFEHGDITLYNWVPTKLTLHAIADEAQTKSLMDLFPGARLEIDSTYSPKDRACEGRHKKLDVYQSFDLHWGDHNQKMHIYGELLRSNMRDQIAWIRDSNHQRKISERNGRESLRMANEASELATAAETGRS